MDKASERKADSKKFGDEDLGVHTFGPGNKIDRMESICCHASEEVVGLFDDRVRSNYYGKKKEKGEGSKKEAAADIVDEIINGGPPLWNVSSPKRVF